MNWLSALPALLALLGSLKSTFVSPTPPVAPTAPGTVAVPAPAADQAVKDLQSFLNTALALNPPLVVDGWLGPKTDAAIEAGIAQLRAAGIGR